jgi:signal peptide peptidase SppA
MSHTVKLSARPAGHDYRTELERRFGTRVSLCRMDLVDAAGVQRKPYQVAERVALIEITGVLTNDAWWWDETEYGQIQREVKMAAEDPDVDGILLRISSPGGETDNAFETAAVLAEAGKKKPMWAVADTIAYSAGYLLASQAAKIYVPPISGGVGSIGVYAAHLDFSGYLEQAGVKVTLISAGKGKTDGNPYEPLSESARKKIVAEVDRLYGEFVAAVARGRSGLAEQEIRGIGADLFQGSKAALGSGLADRAGSVDEAWFDLASSAQQAKNSSIVAAAAVAALAIKEKSMPPDTVKPDAAAAAAPVVSQLPAADPETLREEGRSAAAQVVQLCKIAGKPELASEFIDQKLTARQVGEKLLALQSEEAGDEIHSHVKGGTSASPTSLNLDENPVVKACDQIAGRMRAQKGGN